MSQGHNPVAIANYFIELNNKTEHLLDLMKLLKLSYIAHGFSLGILEEELSNELAEAWKYGPVFPSIYYAFKDQNPYNIENPKLKVKQNVFKKEEENIIKQTFASYGKLDGWKLSLLTHQEHTPWHTHYNKPNGGKDLFEVKIPNEDIKKYFKEEILNKLSTT